MLVWVGTYIPKKFSFSGVYKLNHPDCKKAYIGQTYSNFTGDTMNTNVPLGTIAIPPNSHSIQMNIYSPTEP